MAHPGAARACVAALEADELPGSTARDLVVGFAELERLAAARAVTLTASRLNRQDSVADAVRALGSRAA